MFAGECWLAPARNAPTARRGRGKAASTDNDYYVCASPSSLRSSNITSIIVRRFSASPLLKRRKSKQKTPTAKAEHSVVLAVLPSAFPCCSYRVHRFANLAARVSVLRAVGLLRAAPVVSAFASPSPVAVSRVLAPPMRRLMRVRSVRLSPVRRFARFPSVALRALRRFLPNAVFARALRSVGGRVAMPGTFI